MGGHFLKTVKRMAKSKSNSSKINPLIFKMLHPLPSVVLVEPTNVCNLRCTTCFSNDREKGYMPPFVFHKIIR